MCSKKLTRFTCATARIRNGTNPRAGALVPLSNWEILNSSMEFTKLDSNTIEFRADVAPGEEKVITYTVRYTWPQ